MHATKLRYTPTEAVCFKHSRIIRDRAEIVKALFSFFFNFQTYKNRPDSCPKHTKLVKPPPSSFIDSPRRLCYDCPALYIGRIIS